MLEASEITWLTGRYSLAVKASREGAARRATARAPEWVGPVPAVSRDLVADVLEPRHRASPQLNRGREALRASQRTATDAHPWAHVQAEVDDQQLAGLGVLPDPEDLVESRLCSGAKRRRRGLLAQEVAQAQAWPRCWPRRC